jgi:hypothetical protein
MSMPNLKTGEFPEGTVIVKELTRVLKPTFPDGSRTEPSGRGYFNGEYNGIDLSVKDKVEYKAIGGQVLSTGRNTAHPSEISVRWLEVAYLNLD